MKFNSFSIYYERFFFENNLKRNIKKKIFYVYFSDARDSTMVAQRNRVARGVSFRNERKLTSSDPETPPRGYTQFPLIPDKDPIESITDRI